MKNALIIIVLLSLYSCSSKESNGFVVESGILVYREYDRGRLAILKQYTMDTTLNGITEIYKNDEYRKVNYQNGKLSGMDSTFYPSGNLKRNIQWYDSIKIHEGYTYHDSTMGMLVSEGSDTAIVDYPVLKSFYYHDSQGAEAFQCYYNSDLSINEIEGSGIVTIFEDTTLNTFNIFLAVPPFTKGILRVIEEYPNNKFQREIEVSLGRNDIMSTREDFTKIQLQFRVYEDDQVVYTDVVTISRVEDGTLDLKREDKLIIEI